ncbi:hypothetical protein [Xanthomonas sp. D-109]|uniref:hypothetical protein n=1 Tax=Xanthomonas sp. D-109 TaxID=2821274 RepID=UPI001ADA5B33|nr:hypothetical protein [Xanthomonas sp. D-109]MBO9881217.1 hypothetical protein [Xanthomonas sp. D-109]
MTVQDDERERELSALFGLDWDAAHERHGVDALLPDVVVDGVNYQFEVEVKSSTAFDIGTARDFGMSHIERWRKMFFVFGFYTKERRPELRTSLCLTPMDMEPWLAGKEAQILIDYKLAECLPHRLQLDDLFSVCGERDTYSIEDAKKLHKQQYSAAQYVAAADVVQDGVPCISQANMLKILRERALYVAQRGATVNNPHITKTYLTPFLGTDREVIGRVNCAAKMRALAESFIRQHPGHPSATIMPPTGLAGMAGL